MRLPFVTPLALPLLATLLLAGCGPLPRPYQPVEKSVDLAALIREESIGVSLPSGAPTAGAEAFREAVVDALVTAGLPAAATDAAPARKLSIAIETSDSGDRQIVTAHWHYDGTEGDAPRTEEIEVRTPVPADGWLEGDPVVLEAVAGAGARRLAERLAQPPEGPPPIPGFADARVVILPVEGAPGDGDESLEREVAKALRAADVRLAPLPEADDLLLQGRVETTPPNGGEQGIRIAWILLSARDFREIGRVGQANLIPAGSLDGAWGDTAAAVADAARDGILDLLKQAAEAKRRALLGL